MAIKGLSIPVFGKYAFNPATNMASYYGGMVNPKAISYTVSVESTENNPLYANNQIAENDIGRFSTGTISLETDDLTQKTTKFLLSIKEVERTYGKEKTVTVLVYDDEQKAPDLGVGIIEEHQNDNVTQYKAVWLKKVNFTIPEDAATTRGEAIEWQTRTIEGTISRSEENGENGVYPWKEEAWFKSESEALEYLKAMLGVGEVQPLEIQSEAGTEEGKTRITVTPEKSDGYTYRYQIGEELSVPEYNEDCSGMTEWDGSAEISAQAGQKILIVECEGTGARKAGIQTVTINQGE